jgi:NAD dependent epimerase/dehydratase
MLTADDLSRFFANTPVVVTGAGGFIGSHLVQALLGYGASVRALVKYNGRADWGNLHHLPPQQQAQLDVWLGDVTDPFWLMKALEGQQVVFHLAALIGIPYSYVAPQHYVQVNVQGTLNVLEACRLHNTPKLIHTSTSETYGTADYTPQDEQHPLKAQSPYAASKIAADKLAESYFASYGLPVATLRPFNAYGPRQSLRAVIPTVVGQALSQPVITLGSLAPTRDFTFVQDTAQAFCHVAAHPDTVGHVWNAGSGFTVSIGDVVNQVKQLLNRPELPVQTDQARVRPVQSEVGCLLANSQKLHQLTGWAPVTPLAQGLQQVIESMQTQADKRTLTPDKARYHV